MMVEDFREAEPPFAQSTKVGDTLRDAREKLGRTIEDIATETRVPLRHLRAIETNDYKALPGKTYAMGFARSYARAVGLDDAEISRQLRAELDTDTFVVTPRPEVYAPADPARVPPRWLAWVTGLVALLVLGGALFAWRMNNRAEVEPVAIEEQAPATVDGQTALAQAAPAPAVPDNAEVVITAKDKVWFRIDDANGKRVHEAELKTGDRYVVPAGSKGLQLRTSRPQAMDVSVAGQLVSTLGPADTLVKNVSLDPASLTARGLVASPAPVATPASSAQSSPFAPPPPGGN